MKKKYILILVLLVIFIVLGIFLVNNKENIFKKESDKKEISNSEEELNYLLDGFPIKEVPLYELDEISSCKFYINFDPKNISTFGDKDFVYYNVVLYTKASKEKFLEYYKNLFDEEIIEEYPIPDMVKGTIGKYRVTAAHYGYDDTGYIQVYLPQNEFTKTNRYFDDFPNLFDEKDSMFVEHENSYGLLNQVGGQTEYTKYFTVIDSGDMNDDGIDDVDEFKVLVEKYEGMYKGKENYNYDVENHLMSWDEDGYEVRISFTEDHGRIYLNIRGSMGE